MRWFQLYKTIDESIVKNVIKQAEDNGYTALVLTVDAQRLGKREADVRNAFALPDHLRLECLESALPPGEGSALERFMKHQVDASMDWNTIKKLQSMTRLPIILKGIQCREDAEIAVQQGIKYLWVSNHGGRQLSDARAGIEILPEIIEVTKGHKDVEVYVDGGIRYGADVFKCLALGANFVFLGRPLLWGNVVGGQQGQTRVMELLKEELYLAMFLCGCNTVSQITPNTVINFMRTRPKL